MERSKAHCMPEGWYFFCYAKYSLLELWKKMDPDGWTSAHFAGELMPDDPLERFDLFLQRGVAEDMAADEFGQKLANIDPRRFESVRKSNSLYRLVSFADGELHFKRMTISPEYYSDLLRRKRRLREIERQFEMNEKIALKHGQVPGQLEIEDFDYFWPIPLHKSIEHEGVVNHLQIHSAATAEQVAAFKRKMERCYGFECRMEQVSRHPEFSFDSSVLERINEF